MAEPDGGGLRCFHSPGCRCNPYLRTHHRFRKKVESLEVEMRCAPPNL